MNFTLKILGSGSAKPGIDRNQSAQVLDVHGRLFLIDCGESAQRQMMLNHISIQKIDSIFISHIHGDHVFGLMPLLSTMGMLGRTVALNIYAPQSFGPILKFFLSYYGEGIAFEIRHIPLSMKSPEEIYHTKNLEIISFPLNHKIETFGFIFREKQAQWNVRKECISEYGLNLTEIGTLKRGEDVHREDGSVIPASEAAYIPHFPRSYAYCSDTAPFAELPSWIKGVDLLYHEATYSEKLLDQAVSRHHSTARQAAGTALSAGVGKLLIGHFSSRYKNADELLNEARSVFENTYAVSDGDTYEIPMK